MNPKTSLRSALVPVGRALQAWRKSRPHRRQPIPDWLWNQLATVARTHGVSAVARALCLAYSALKRRVAEPAVLPEFVEVSVARADDLPPGCMAEMVAPQGRRVVVRWSCVPGPELSGLVQSFWNQGA